MKTKEEITKQTIQIVEQEGQIINDAVVSRDMGTIAFVGLMFGPVLHEKTKICYDMCRAEHEQKQEQKVPSGSVVAEA